MSLANKQKILERISTVYQDSLYNYRDRIINNIVEEEDDEGMRTICINGSEDFIFDELSTVEEEYLDLFMEEVEKILDGEDNDQ